LQLPSRLRRSTALPRRYQETPVNVRKQRRGYFPAYDYR
jgi:hypothetical protein